MKEIRDKIDNIIRITLVVILSLMVINVLYQVGTRYFTSNPSSFTDELSRYFMIWLGILGAAYVAGQSRHVAIDILPKKFSPRVQSFLSSLVQWFVIAFALFGLVIGGSNLVYITFVLNQYSPSLQIPLGVVYLIIPISGLLIIFYKLTSKHV